MAILTQVSAALQRLFGAYAAQAAKDSGVIVRRRKFSALSLARTFVLGFLQNPDASDEELARLAVQCSAAVTPQAVEQRHTPKLVRFLQSLLGYAVQQVVTAERGLAPLLERFTTVKLLDSSGITLPDACQEEFPGCDGGRGGGAAGLKLQVELDLRRGGLEVSVESARVPDGASPRQQAALPKGSLRITDLGYFSVTVFASLIGGGVHFLSRLQFGTAVRLARQEEALALLPWLDRQARPIIDQPIFLGAHEHLACRLLAWRVPAEVAQQRRRHMRQESWRKRNQEPSAARLAWCDWTLLVTSVPIEQLAPQEAAVLYGARWQIELLFKRWKSQGLVAELSGSTAVRQVVRVWSRLLAALQQHWLVVSCAWGDVRKSWAKVSEAVRTFVGRMAVDLDSVTALERLLTDVCAVIEKTCGRNPRAKAGTVELLNDVNRLDFCLT